VVVLQRIEIEKNLKFNKKNSLLDLGIGAFGIGLDWLFAFLVFGLVRSFAF